ncbi:MAG: hypothetical protein KDK78_11865 [Chlamydiia bacterium]|nr:hypothetical protein [Chlamydiia bacterium]
MTSGPINPNPQTGRVPEPLTPQPKQPTTAMEVTARSKPSALPRTAEKDNGKPGKRPPSIAGRALIFDRLLDESEDSDSMGGPLCAAAQAHDKEPLAGAVTKRFVYSDPKSTAVILLQARDELNAILEDLS